MVDVLPPVYIVGLRASGKTSIGRELAALLGGTFWDSDQAIETASGKSSGAWLREDGVAAFRRIEVVQHLAHGLAQSAFVLAHLIILSENGFERLEVVAVFLPFHHRVGIDRLSHLPG